VPRERKARPGPLNRRPKIDFHGQGEVGKAQKCAEKSLDTAGRHIGEKSQLELKPANLRSAKSFLAQPIDARRRAKFCHQEERV